MHEGRHSECSHGDPLDKLKSLKQQMKAKVPEHTDTAKDLEDIKAQLELMGQSANEFWEQMTGIFKLIEGKTCYEGTREEREHVRNGSEIARFSGEDKNVHRGWKALLALKITGKPKMFNIEQNMVTYIVNHLKKVALA
jgi:hypothetical protein